MLVMNRDSWDSLDAETQAKLDGMTGADMSQGGHITMSTSGVKALETWDHDSFDALIRAFAENQGVGFGKVAQPLRAALMGTMNAPGIYEVMEALGKEEALGRISDQLP